MTRLASLAHAWAKVDSRFRGNDFNLQRRRRTGRLARYESDRLYRLARIVALANEYLGDHERAIRWLKHPNRALGGLAPVAAIDTELGARQVENILGRIAYGGIS